MELAILRPRVRPASPDDASLGWVPYERGTRRRTFTCGVLNRTTARTAETRAGAERPHPCG